MQKNPKMLQGEKVMAKKDIVYLPDPPETGLRKVSKGLRGVVVAVPSRGRRLVRFSDGQQLETSIAELRPLDLLDRIGNAIFG